jgi:hypothetical protein
MKKLSTYLLPLSFSLLLVSCGSKELSREEAASAIQKEMEYPVALDFDVYRAEPMQARLALDSNLEEEGFLIVQRTQELKDIGKPMIDFTEKAKPFLLQTSDDALAQHIQKVKLADENFVEITGIKTGDDGKTAVVEYTTSITNITPFSALLPRKLEQTTTSNKANFALYDDGWRLEKKPDE